MRRLFSRRLSSLRNSDVARRTAPAATIYALSTAPSKAAVAVVRISGPASPDVYRKLVRGQRPMLEPKVASVRKLYSKDTLLDQALVLYFCGPKSFTGEDCVELHLHGGVATVNAVLKAIKEAEIANLRYAEPGEFSRRAFQNGKFDLTSAEGMNAMINASTESQRMLALNSMMGSNKKFFEKVREQVLQSNAVVTALLDFGDDYELDEVDKQLQKVQNDVSETRNKLIRYLERARRAKVLLDGVKITLLGPTNAGKSSFLNMVSESDAAIVSDMAGTTRDVINFPMDIAGFKVVFQDTAGVRSGGSDSIEKIGIEKAKENAWKSDLVLVIVDPTQRPDQEFLGLVRELLCNGKCVRFILNKIDLLQSVHKVCDEVCATFGVPEGEKVLPISCLHKTGSDELLQTLQHDLKSIVSSQDIDPISLSARSQEIVENEILAGIADFETALDSSDLVMAAMGLKTCAEGIGKITGDAIGVEEILGVVFSSFCIGK